MTSTAIRNVAFALCACTAASVQAYDLPAVNLGATSFLDGAPPAGPGWYFTQYFQYITADRLHDNSGNKLPLPRQDLDLTVSLSQLIYQSTTQFLGGNPGIDFILPWVVSAKVDDGLGNQVLKADEGIGDLVVGPFVQWGPVMGPAGPRYAQRVEFQFLLPTGDYERTNAVNPGSNFWSFNPYWSGTYWFSPNWSGSLRMHYLWNAKNKDPNVAFGSVGSTRAGQALHANFATEYAVTPQFRVGLNGYWLQQISDTEADGNKISGRREKVWAVGPGIMYSFSQHDHLFFNAYFEQDAKNRPEGQRFTLRYVHHFQ